MNDHPTNLGGVDVSRETYEKLDHLCALITKWTKSINLVAPNSIPGIWHRHIADSTQIYHHAPDSWSTWMDLGSGGGLPGLVVAILDPKNRQVTLVESDQRKCLFLSTAKRELDLNVVVQNKRIEALESEKTDILSARALAPLPDLLTHAHRLLGKDGTALFPKGARYQEELDQAAQDWHFDVTAHQSQTNADSRILELSRIRPREH